MYCAKCGTKYEGDFCPNCGTPAPKKTPAKNNKLDVISLGLKGVMLILWLVATLVIRFDSVYLNIHESYSGRLLDILGSTGEIADRYGVVSNLGWMVWLVIVALIGSAILEVLKGKSPLSRLISMGTSVLIIAAVFMGRSEMAEFINNLAKVKFGFSTMLLLLVCMINIAYALFDKQIKKVLTH